MEEEARDWEVSIRSDLEVVYVQSNKARLSIETIIQDGLTREEALAVLATMGEVERFVAGLDYFYVRVKK